MCPPDDHAPRIRAAPRLQPRHRLQGPLVGDADAFRAAAADERQSPLSPGDVDVLSGHRPMSSFSHHITELSHLSGARLAEETTLSAVAIAAASAIGLVPYGTP